VERFFRLIGFIWSGPAVDVTCYASQLTFAYNFLGK